MKDRDHLISQFAGKERAATVQTVTVQDSTLDKGAPTH